MEQAASSSPSQDIVDCTICLSSLTSGTALVTLSCNHKFHLQCLALNLQAQNNSCPLCRMAIETDILKLFTTTPVTAAQVQAVVNPVPVIPPSMEEPIDETNIQVCLERAATARQSAITENVELIQCMTTLEYGAQLPNMESNIYGLVTLQAPAVPQEEIEQSMRSRLPVDLVCVVDRSGSMGGQKIQLLKDTLTRIIDQLNEYDRLAIVSFNTSAFDLSRGLKRMTVENQQSLRNSIIQDLTSTGGTYIGSGLTMAIELLQNRRTKNPVSALLLLTDGQDNEVHDYTTLMRTLPEGVQCHTFGYGEDHTASLLVQIAQLGNDGSFTYIDEFRAIGLAFAIVLAGIFTCIAKEIQATIEFDVDYKVTHFHSLYKYEPTTLPSSKLTISLPNLNSGEKRNLLFQLHVPKLIDTDDRNMTSQDSMSQEEHVTDHLIGHASVTYLNPKNDSTLKTNPVGFTLARSSNPTSDLLQVNHVLDCQRNRIETTNALESAMQETDYKKSRDILRAQADKIRASVSAQDPFCQELIVNLEQLYPSESHYRSSHANSYRCHQSERGTYASNNNTTSTMYQTRHQRGLAEALKRKYSS